METQQQHPENQSTVQDETAIINDGKAAALIAYLTVTGLIVAFLMNSDKKNKFAQYHIRQSVGINASALAIVLVGIIPILGWIILFFGFFLLIAMFINGIVNAANGRYKSVFLMGKKYEEWFKGV